MIQFDEIRKEIASRLPYSMSKLQLAQAAEKLSGEYLGKEMEFIGCYKDINVDTIDIEAILVVQDGFIVHKEGGRSLHVKYDSDKYKKTLLTFPKDGTARITGTIYRFDPLSRYYRTIYIDLISIVDCNAEMMKYIETRAIKIDGKNYQEIPKACFIATACYGDYDSVEVLTFRRYRDERLLNKHFGRFLVSFYYLVSPGLARIIAKSNWLKSVIKNYLLQPLLKRIEQKL